MLLLLCNSLYPFIVLPVKVRRGNGDHSQNPEVSSRKIILHPSHLQQELSSLNPTFPSLATCSIFSCLPLLCSLSISFWSPREALSSQQQRFSVFRWQFCSVIYCLSSWIAGLWNWHWLPVSHSGPWALCLYVTPFHPKGCTWCSFQEVLLYSFLHPTVLSPTVGYSDDLLSLICNLSMISI